MTDSAFTCPDGHNVEELLSYVEGDLDEDSRIALERHLESCIQCAEEVASLRRMDRLLREHPEVLHPKPEELYRFVDTGEDWAGNISSHVAWCKDCTEDVEMLRAMLDQGRAASQGTARMPKKLIRRLEQAHGKAKATGPLESLRAFFADMLGIPLRIPSLALGTGAAALIIALVSVPLWHTYKSVEVPVQTRPTQAPLESVVKELPALAEEESVANGVAEKPHPEKARPAGTSRIPDQAPRVYAPQPTAAPHDGKDEVAEPLTTIQNPGKRQSGGRLTFIP